jgi:hypothetical protein
MRIYESSLGGKTSNSHELMNETTISQLPLSATKSQHNHLHDGGGSIHLRIISNASQLDHPDLVWSDAWTPGVPRTDRPGIQTAGTQSGTGVRSGAPTGAPQSGARIKRSGITTEIAVKGQVMKAHMSHHHACTLPKLLPYYILLVGIITVLSLLPIHL